MWGDHVGEDRGPGETRVPPNERGNLHPYGTGMGDRARGAKIQPEGMVDRISGTVRCTDLSCSLASQFSSPIISLTCFICLLCFSFLHAHA